MITSSQKLLMGTAGVVGSRPWDISTAVYVQRFSVSSQTPTPTSVFFKPDGTKMYVLGFSFATPGLENVYEYDLSTAWDISTASFLQSFSVSAEEFYPSGLFLKTDGTKMYVIGSNGDDVNEYDLSTAWDISTASFLQSAGIGGQESVPEGLFFKPDGTKMYITGTSGDDVNEYDLSTAWDISTRSYVQNFSVSAQESNPRDLFFKPDGTKMYVLGSSGDNVNEYDLSTAWDISTASYLQNFSVSGQESNPVGLFFKPDGTKMYISGDTGNDINEYDIG